jgi:exopolysaccharide biosynthesis polyprenyl glycosylphosphotransferase
MTEVARIRAGGAEPATLPAPPIGQGAARPVLVAPPAGREPVAAWSRRYVATLLVEDALCAIAAIAIGFAARFGPPSDAEVGSYLLLSAIFTLGWLLALHLVHGYDLRAVAAGPREYYVVLRAALNLAGSAAIVAYLTHLLIARTFIAIVIPVGAVLQMLARYAVRRSVQARRTRGEWTSTILAVGTSESVRHLVDVTRRNPHAGLVVVGACVEDAAPQSLLTPDVPVLGDVSHAAEVAGEIGADIVAVAGSGLGPHRIRQLGWQLEGTGRNMVMAPGLTEVAGPRVHVTPVEGLPLMWVDQPQFSGLARVAKRALDVLVAGLLLLLGAPVLLLIGLVVRLTSAGPALYRSRRVGLNGQLFTVYKFRSMYADADARRAALVELNEVEGGVLFKIREDPRVTPVGRVLRKLSLDELPQLLNVLGGTMSLVGPRPPLPDEVERYHSHVHRRLLVKPGMTGLWQVSGRSDLSWDEAVRLDLYYVENWSLGFDIAIILRTIWVVIRSRGAY